MASPDKETFMVHFRWITPLVLTLLLGMMGFVVSEIRALRLEIAATREFGVKYTNTMINLILKMGKNQINTKDISLDGDKSE